MFGLSMISMQVNSGVAKGKAKGGLSPPHGL